MPILKETFIKRSNLEQCTYCHNMKFDYTGKEMKQFASHLTASSSMPGNMTETAVDTTQTNGANEEKQKHFMKHFVRWKQVQKGN